MEILKLIASTLLSIVSIFIITKCMGHKQVAQLDFFDYVSGITIGSVAAELATNLEEVWKPLIALVLYGLASVLLSLLTRRCPRARRFINGTPTILFHDGKLYRKNLKKAKFDLSEFLLLCREQGFFDLNEVQTVVFEHNGKLSVLPKASCRPATPSDHHLKVKEAHIGVEVIMDGRILEGNLRRVGRDVPWLLKQLKARHAVASDMFLAVYHAEEDTLDLYTTGD